MVSLVDMVGFSAAAASLIAIASSNILTLRIAMILSNILFIIWGVMGMLLPPLALHAIILPINLWRLWQLLGPRFRKRSDPGELATGPGS